ncbi:MAG: HlyC/CorC family transporter [Chloroflexi bacterium]|nr:HlyC/CorC family transporter [Chloroflexota bacterium]
MAAEFALVSLRRSRIEQMVDERHRFGRMLLRAKDDPNRFISAAQLGITMASLGLGWIGESTVAALIEPLFHGLPEQYLGSAVHTISFAISFTLITMLHIVLGEQVPKMVSLQHAERTAIVTVGPTEAFYRVFRPFIAAFTGLTNLALAVMRIEPANEHEGAVTAEELELMVQTSHRAGALEDTERDLLSNVFDFADLSVYQVMIQRRDMVGVSVESTLDDLLELAEGSPHSRFPVYEESLDNVIGVIHIKDLLRAARRDHADFDLRGTMRQPLFVPETMPAGRLLSEFRRAHTTLAVVIDEYGGTAGLVTIDDVVEEIVGDVPDEFHAQTPSVEPQPDGTSIVAPTLRLDELDEHFDIEVDEDGEVDTVGGLVVEKLGRLAQTGDVVELEHYRLAVEEVEGVRITRLRLIPLQPASTAERAEEGQGS